jgi:hypothetical protein
MLAPHHGKNSQLGDVRFASENFFDTDKFLRRQAMPDDNFGRDLGIESGVRHRRTKISETLCALKSTERNAPDLVVGRAPIPKLAFTETPTAL